MMDYGSRNGLVPITSIMRWRKNMINIHLGIPHGPNSCEAKCEIAIDDDGLWYAKWTCPKHPDFLLFCYYDQVAAKNYGKRDRVKTTKGVHHWGNKVDSFMYEN